MTASRLLVAYLAALLVAGATALAVRVAPVSATRAGAALQDAFRAGVLHAPLAAAWLATLGLWATHAMRRARTRGTEADAARRGQGLRVPFGGLAIAALAWSGPAGGPLGPDGVFVGAALLVAAFPALIAERIARAAPRSAEADALHALLLLPVASLLLCGLAAIAASLGAPAALLAPAAARLLLGAIAVELAARAFGRWFLPPPPPATARAATGSLLAAILAGAFGEGLTRTVRAQSGLDFSRSYALRYLRAAALPGLAGLALAGFALSGLKQVGLSERAIYERLGSPVRVLGPGLHAILPWPLGRLRRTEFGQVNDLPLGAAAAAAPRIDAEATPDAAQDRLWSGTHPNESTFLIGSDRAGEGGGFQAVSADLRLLWRVGSADADAERSVYAAENPQTLILATAHAALTAAFARTRLDALLGNPAALRDAARDVIAADAKIRAAGIEIVDLVVEAVHPPAEASAAYHGVQAAEIASRTEIAIADRTARSRHNAASSDARTWRDQALAHAAEATGAATGLAAKFAAERDADATGPGYGFERRLAATIASAGPAHLTLLDPTLPTATIDLRPEGQVPATVQTAD